MAISTTLAEAAGSNPAESINDSMSEYSKNIYNLPVKKEKITQIITDQHEYPEEKRTHTKNIKFAVDIHVPLDSEVFAAFDGEVTAIKEDGTVGGPEWKFEKDGNFVVIKHVNSEFTQYHHLKYKGVLVKPGDKVKTGQLIAYTGFTGFLKYPHIHFEVFVWPSPTATPAQRQTIKVRFKEIPDVYESKSNF
jgi:murein DD-endopeptidase MepM/ murein hydrolase activator NlpD